VANKPTVSNTIPIILAAGKGARMGSVKNKCLLNIEGKPLLEWTILTLKKLRFPKTIIVTRSTDPAVEKFIDQTQYEGITVTQDPFFLGAGHGLFVGTFAIKKSEKCEYILCLYGDDSFLYKAGTLFDFLSKLPQKSPLQILTTKRKVIGTIGGLKRDQNDLPNGFYTRTELDKLNATTAEIVCGAFLFNFDWLKRHFHKIAKNKKSGELLLTSLIQVAHDENTPVSVFELTDPKEWCGVNTPDELKQAKALKKEQLINEL